MRHKTDWELVARKLDELNGLLLPDWVVPIASELREQILPFIERRRQRRGKAAEIMRTYRATPEGHRKHLEQNRIYQLKKRIEKDGKQIALPI